MAKVDEPSLNERPLSRSQSRGVTPGLDLICTKVAVDFQSITAETAAERITTGLQALTEACGADSIFVALVDESGSSFDQGVRRTLDVLGLQPRGAARAGSSTSSRGSKRG